MFGLQVHAQVQFELLEGAMLALKTLDGFKMQGLSIKVFLLCATFLIYITGKERLKLL